MCVFLVLGIWDCLTSQQVVDIIRYQVSLGKELEEICEMMCDHCLSPDTSSGAGIGCDNMTVMIIAILHGRTKEEWYTWVTERVSNDHGYQTPTYLPQIYAQSRILAYRARKEALDAREREREARERERELERVKQEKKEEVSLTSSGLSGFTKILSSTAGISFTLGSTGVMSDSGTPMFENDDSDDDEDSEDEETSTPSLPSDTPGVEQPKSPDPTKHLKAKLDELEREIQEEGDDDNSQMADAGDSSSAKGTGTPTASSNTSQPDLQGEAPPPPKHLPNGDASAPVEQLQAHPHGDEPLPVLKAEGLIDSSEDPLVTA
jgi:protein phosphatase 2C family protein 2/3